MITFKSKWKWRCINSFVVITDLLLQRITDKPVVCMIWVSHFQQLFITNCAIESPTSVNNIRHFPVHRKTEILLQYNCFFIFINYTAQDFWSSQGWQDKKHLQQNLWRKENPDSGIAKAYMKILSQTMPKCNVRSDKDTDTIPIFLLVLYKVSSFCLLIRPLFLHLHHIKLEDFYICLQGEMKLSFFPSAILTISLAFIK